jgi:hypothetical protein
VLGCGSLTARWLARVSGGGAAMLLKRGEKAEQRERPRMTPVSSWETKSCLLLLVCYRPLAWSFGERVCS